MEMFEGSGQAEKAGSMMAKATSRLADLTKGLWRTDGVDSFAAIAEAECRDSLLVNSICTRKRS